MIMVNVKGEVEYKLPKKMKKRRQLDALVDTVKLPRGRKNGSSAQELLDYNSDSTDIDEYSLPTMAAKRKNRCCVCHSMIARISLFIISMACMTTCFGLIWVQWHIRHELNTLRSQVHAVQTTDKEPSSAVIKLQNYIDQVNKTFMDIKRGVDEFNKTVKDISTRITTLEGKTSELEKTVSLANDYINAPKTVNDLANTVAKLGSDLTNSKNDFDVRLKNLETSVKQSAPVDINSVSQLLKQDLKQDLADLHQLVAEEFQNMTKDISLHSSKLSALESLVTSAQSATMNNSIASVLKLNDQVSAALKDMTEFNFTGNVTDRGEFLAFKLETLSNTEQINKTLYTLSDEFDVLSTHIETIDSAILNITSVLNTIKKESTN